MVENTSLTQELRDELTGATYDETPYESYAYPMTFPDRMAAISTIFGYDHVDLENARVLELGCASGGNILPLAALFPNARFLGVDLSPKQIEDANTHKASLELDNIEFKAMDIMDLDESSGEFDYIICHGVFSWVPDFVRTKCLEICRDNLSRNGVACVSFNVLPGWAPLRSIREMMILHTKDIEKQSEKVEQARLLAKSLYDHMPKDASLRRTVENVHQKFEKTTNDSYILHEYLEPNNQPFYFHEYAELLQQHDLSYIGDSDITMMHPENINPELGKVLSQIPDSIKREQYLDFVSNRQFRYSVITKKSNKPSEITLDALEKISYGCTLIPENKEYDPVKPMKFSRPDASNFHVTTADQTGKALFWALSQQRDYYFTFEQLVSLLQKALETEDLEKIQRALKSNLLNFLLKGALVFKSTPSTHPQTVSNKPKTFALARYQSALPGCNIVTNINGAQISLNSMDPYILRYLDGTRNMNQLTNAVAPHVECGDITLRRRGMPITDPTKQKKELKALLPQFLENYQKKHLLES